MQKKFQFISLVVVGMLMAGLLINSVPLATQAAPMAPNAAISLSSNYTQNFDSLGISGGTWTNDSTISGWYASRTNYLASTGSSNTGGLYSFGSSSSSERALGSIASNSAGNIYYGVRFVNDTGSDISSLRISFTSEQWRNGGNTSAHQLDFSYQVGTTMTSLTTGTWTDENSLGFVSPIHTSSASALDGNLSVNSTELSATINLTIPAGQEIMLRWMDSNDSGSDHGLSIDDLSINIEGSGDTAPTISSTNPANNGSSVTVGSNITVNFSESVDVTGTWYDISCTTSWAHNATVSGGPQSFTLNPDADFVSNETCTATIYAAQVSDQDTDDPPDVMAADYVWSFTTEGSPAPCSTIPLIQGTGNASTCQGHRDNIEGCITGVTAKGFYFQDISGDGNPASSDGMFAYFWSTWDNPSSLQAGDFVSVSGNVTEYYDTTEFAHSGSDNLDVSVNGTCTPPAPVSVGPNLDPTTDPMTLYERYESMRVQMTFDGWVVGPTKRFNSRHAFGDPEIAFVDFGSTISDYGRVFQSDYPGYQGINYLSGGLNFDLPELDFGDDIAGTNISGVLGYQFDKYTLLVDAIPTLVTVDNPTTTTPQTVADNAKLEFDFCYYNVENLFDNLDDSSGDWGDWAPGWPTPGTPEGLAEYQAHLNENVAVLYNDAKSCMVIGLSEVEGKQAIYDDLAAALSALDAAHTWTGIYVASGDARNITQGFLYRDDAALLNGPTPVSGSPYIGWVSDSTLDFRRVPAAAEFRFFASTDAEVDVTAYAVHFKSKRASGSCSTDDCTDIRELEAADLRDILEHHQGAREYAVAGGDFNDYIASSPISILSASTDVYNLFDDLPANEQYSFIFSGESEVLDYIFVTQNMLSENGFMWGRAFDAIHVNANFPASEHASDHDPVRVRFLGADLSDLAASYGEAWHTIPHLVTLGDSISNDAGSALNGDNGSDTGVSIVAGTWSPGQSVTIRVEVVADAGYPNSSAWFSGWFDWDLNGTFESGERTVNQAVNIGQTDITFTVPAGAQIGIGGNDDTYMPVRFRLYESTAEPLAALITPMAAEISGGVAGGEVEDYVWGFWPTAITLQSFGSQISEVNWMAALILISGFGGISFLVLCRIWKRKHSTEISR